MSPPKRPVLPTNALLKPRVWKRVEADNYPQAQASDLLWSPDGRWAAYVLIERRYPVAHPDDFYRESLCCIRADGRGARRLYSGGVTSGSLAVHTVPEVAAWSPDSQRILFWKCYPMTGSANADGSPLFDIPITGGTPRLLTTPYRRRDGGLDDGMMRKPENLVFSPDGKYLLLVAGYGQFAVEQKRIARVAYPSGRRTWLTETDRAAIEPAWSPDGRQIAFVMTADQEPLGDSSDIFHRLSRLHLWTMNADGTGRRPLTHDPRYRESTPNWITLGISGGKSAAVIRFIRDDNTDLSDNVPYGSRRSLWEISPDGTKLRWIRKLPP